MALPMRNDPIAQLLTAIHQNVDALCRDLQHDRPDLAAAVRQRAAAIPRPYEPSPPSTIAPRRSVARLGPLLYDALDEGVIDAREFDRLMLDRQRATRALAERAEP